MFLGSSCIYPKFAPQPLDEGSLLTGLLEPTNEPYAVAKIAGIKMCDAYNRQYGVDYRSVMPTNLYGPGDNYHPQNAHVLPALIRRFHEAKLEGSANVVIWGTGRPKREFLHVDDAADACVFVMDLDRDSFERSVRPESPQINIGSGVEITIADLARMVASAVGFNGTISFDENKPDGTPRKLLNSSRLADLGWTATTSFVDGLKSTYEDFLASPIRAA